MLVSTPSSLSKMSSFQNRRTRKPCAFRYASRRSSYSFSTVLPPIGFDNQTPLEGRRSSNVRGDHELTTELENRHPRDPQHRPKATFGRRRFNPHPLLHVDAGRTSFPSPSHSALRRARSLPLRNEGEGLSTCDLPRLAPPRRAHEGEFASCDDGSRCRRRAVRAIASALRRNEVRPCFSRST